MILIDANIFLELALDQENAEDCALLLAAISDGDLEAIVTHFAVHAVEASLRKGKRLTDFLRNIDVSQGLRIYDTTVPAENSASIIAEKIGKDFDDGLQYYVAKKTGATAIVSFAKHFDGRDIPRIVPRQALRRGSKGS